jgi:Asp-tRNA(Asn)/Glu-tRNA(Gln) amidotransferase A subunit family amidase
MNHPQDLTLRQQATAIRRGDLDAVELLELTLSRIVDRDGSINSTPVLFEDASRAMLATAPHGPLFGVPVTVKDMFSLPWRAARNGTATDLIPATASGPYRRLRDAGAVVVGIANQHEMGMGTSGVYSAYGPMGNPWDPAHCAGGSSGGSAGAVAARLVAASLGSDSGGSTRVPASYCGVVGLKVTYGSLPYDGYFGALTSLSAPGVFARSGADARLLAEALLDRPLPGDLRAPLRVGVVREPFWNDVDPEVGAACDAALRASGWTVVELQIDHLELTGAAFLSRLIAEVGLPPSSVMDGLSHPTRALLLAGMLLPARSVPRADRVRAAIRQSLATAFDSVDILAWPSTPTPAPTLSDPWVDLPSGRTPVDGPNLRQAAVANLTGVPGISVPVGFHSTHLPIGLQLLAPWNDEARLLDAAEHLERVTDFASVNATPAMARAPQPPRTPA